jgi:hypothetical protein
MPDNYNSNTTNFTVTAATGYTIGGVQRGDRPPSTPKELIATRAVEAKGGWLGQILMAGEIVHETKHHETADDALEEVHTHILKKFKKLIVGVA